MLTADRNTPRRADDTFVVLPVAAATVIYAGALVALDASGNATKGATATGLVGLGRAEEAADNAAGDAGDIEVRVRRGIFRWQNSAGEDEIDRASIGDACWIVDDHTVAKTTGGATRSRAGIVVDVDAQGVWVDMSSNTLNGPVASLLAANNLSDVGTKATARANLGVYERFGTPSFVIGADAGTTINVGIQLKDSAGVDLAVRGSVLAYLSNDANGDSIATTAPSGGWAIGTDGVLIPLVAGKAAQLVSESDGDIDVTITEAGAATWYLVLVMPDGRLVVSTAITFS